VSEGWGVRMDGMNPFKAYVKGVSAKAKDKQALYAEAGRIMTLSFIPSVFRAKGAVDGSPVGEWPPLKAKRKRGALARATPLQNTGRMRDSITFSASAEALTIGTPLRSASGYPYPAVHQYGSTRTFNKDGSMRIPARTFLFWTRAVLAKISARWKTMVFARDPNQVSL
jgi:phage gpG-like protein